ncbi:hypothetical protein TNCV_4919971 [Trichonephila clavipes]|nr:hypothetical protein TNCV_4919971 [Trichonephila clavipes]
MLTTGRQLRVLTYLYSVGDPGLFRRFWRALEKVVCVAAGRTFVYFYSRINVGFINSSKSAAPWTVCKNFFLQDPPHDKPSKAAFAMGSYRHRLAG